LLSLALLDQHIAECREQVESGQEKQATLDTLLQLREDLAKRTRLDWAAYNELMDHLPEEGADSTLVILKGQLLLEKLTRKFVQSRLPNPYALDALQWSAAQYIAIAESMCLANAEPKWLWTQIKELNSIRNKLAHSLDGGKVEARISNFVVTVSRAQKLQSKTLTSVIARLYGMLMGICDLSESKDFRAFKR
jgi:hypothetical protein